MPTETFCKLSCEKREKIIQAAKKEFSRVPISEASIKNIVQNAEIARGSFYQYFESKEDLLWHIMKNYFDGVDTIIIETLKNDNGDLFKVFEKIYEFSITNFLQGAEVNLYRRVFENIKINQESKLNFMNTEDKMKKFETTLKYINTDTLKITDKNEIGLLVKTLHMLTNFAIASNIPKEDFIKQLEFIKMGVAKE